MLNRDYDYALRWSKKLRAINSLGGKCNKCGNDNIACLDFHHYENNKEESFNRLVGGRWSNIEKEIKKCMLLCKNCHSEEHNSNDITSTCNNLKVKFLEFKGVDRCQKCGYKGKNYSSLDFHHRDKESKSFCIGSAYAFISSKRGQIEEELKKCDVLCRNCHAIEHFDFNRFQRLNATIEKKAKEYIELKIVDWDELKKLNLNGVTNEKICQVMKLSPSTVSTILKRLNLNAVKLEREHPKKKKTCSFCKSEFYCFEKENIDKRMYCSMKCKQNGERKLTIEKEELVKMLKTGSYSSLARKYNVVPNTIKNLAKRYGLI